MKATLLKNKKTFLDILYSLLTFFGFLYYYNILISNNNYNIVTMLGFLAIYWFYSKINFNTEERTKKYSIILAVIFSSILIIGNKVYISFEKTNIESIFSLLSIVASIISIVGFSLFFYRLIYIMLIKIKDVNIISSKQQHLKCKYFIFGFLLMIILWLPYFIRFFPGILTHDSYRVLNMANLGVREDHHAFGYISFVGLIWKFGMLLFNNMNMATAFYVIIQMIILSFIYNFSIKYFYDRGLKRWIAILLYILFALSPLHAYYSITIWKDVMFASMILLLTISLYEFIKTNFNPKILFIIIFVISVLGMCFFRNNGIYIYIFLFSFLILFTKNNKLLLRSIYTILLVSYFVIKGPVYNYLGVKPTEAVESFSIPLQQIARVISSDRNIDKKTLKSLNKFIDVSKIKDEYTLTISDPIKHITNSEYLGEHKLDFIKIWGQLLLKYPNDYIDAYLCQTLGYWYPNTVYWTVGGISVKPQYETEKIYNTNTSQNILFRIIDLLDSKEVPFSMFIWSTGLQFIILLFSTVIVLYKYNSKVLLCFIPAWALWISIMVATPVFSELRYIYGIFVSIPFLLIISLLSREVSKNRKGFKNEV